MRLDRLPGWVIDNDESVRREVAPYVEVDAARRWEATRRCCSAAMAILEFHSDAARALSYRDPLPHTTIAALDRLRAAQRAAR